MYRTTRADRRRNIDTYAHWVYGLYLEDKLVYVGVTADPAARAAAHYEKKVFDEFRLIKGFSNRLKADEFEKYGIASLRPPLNVMILSTDYQPRQMAKKDFDRFCKSGLAEDYDLLNIKNAGVARRIKWEERNSNG